MLSTLRNHAYTSASVTPPHSIKACKSLRFTCALPAEYTASSVCYQGTLQAPCGLTRRATLVVARAYSPGAKWSGEKVPCPSDPPPLVIYSDKRDGALRLAAQHPDYIDLRLKKDQFGAVVDENYVVMKAGHVLLTLAPCYLDGSGCEWAAGTSITMRLEPQEVACLTFQADQVHEYIHSGYDDKRRVLLWEPQPVEGGVVINLTEMPVLNTSALPPTAAERVAFAMASGSVRSVSATLSAGDVAVLMMVVPAMLPVMYGQDQRLPSQVDAERRGQQPGLGRIAAASGRDAAAGGRVAFGGPVADAAAQEVKDSSSLGAQMAPVEPVFLKMLQYGMNSADTLQQMQMGLSPPAPPAPLEEHHSQGETAQQYQQGAQQGVGQAGVAAGARGRNAQSHKGAQDDDLRSLAAHAADKIGGAAKPSTKSGKSSTAAAAPAAAADEGKGRSRRRQRSSRRAQ